MDAYEKRRINDITGLGWLHRAGWLRTAELGRLLWPENRTSQQQADRLARGWLERRLVLARDLPEGAGRALVLATGGVRLLADHGVEASSGKDLGRVDGQEWTAPLSWRHQLLAAGILARLHQAGWTVYPEREIRQRAGWLAKIPDGLAVRGSTVAWLEVERAHKTGTRNAKPLVDALCAISDGQAPTVLGHRPNVGLVAYQAGARDSRGCSLDHQARIRAAVAAAAKRDVRLWWARCQLRGPAALGAMEISEEIIKADRAAAILKRLSWREKEDEPGVQVAGYDGHLAYVWEDEPGWWGYQVDDLPGDREQDQAAARRACAGVLAGLPPK